MMKERIENRCQELERWLDTVLEQPFKRLSLLPWDASVRRYFRVYCKDITYVAVDASLQKESCEAFIAIAKEFYKLGLNVPVIYTEDKKERFLLLTDFGDQLYVHALNKIKKRPMNCIDVLLMIFCAFNLARELKTMLYPNLRLTFIVNRCRGFTIGISKNI